MNKTILKKIVRLFFFMPTECVRKNWDYSSIINNSIINKLILIKKNILQNSHKNSKFTQYGHFLNDF